MLINSRDWLCPFLLSQGNGCGYIRPVSRRVCYGECTGVHWRFLLVPFVLAVPLSCSLISQTPVLIIHILNCPKLYANTV